MGRDPEDTGRNATQASLQEERGEVNECGGDKGRQFLNPKSHPGCHPVGWVNCPLHTPHSGATILALVTNPAAW